MSKPQPAALAPVLAALVLSAAADRSHAMTPALIDPDAIAGTWALSSGGKTCHLSLGVSHIEGGKAYELDIGDCVEAGMPRLRGWAPEADGIGFVLDGGRVLFLSRQDADHFTGHGRDGRDYALTRNG